MYTKLSSKGQVVIPKGVRDSIDLKYNDKLSVEILGDGQILLKKMKKLEDIIGTAKRVGNISDKEAVKQGILKKFI